MRLPDWPTIRAALLLLVIALNVASALPAPMRISPAHFARPDAREEVDGWLRVFEALGWDVPRPTLERAVTTVVNGWVDARTAVIGRPTKELRRWLGVRQNWALFARPDTWPSALVVEVAGPQEPWVEVYRSLHPEHDLLASQLRYRRIRGLYDVGDRPGATYYNLASWIAARAFEAHPEATQVRVRLVRSHTTRPGEPTDPTQKVFGQTVVPRDRVRR